MANKELLATTVELAALEFSEALRNKIGEMESSQDTHLIEAVSAAALALTELVGSAVELGELVE